MREAGESCAFSGNFPEMSGYMKKSVLKLSRNLVIK
jgi:hypothetical protein